MELSTKKKAIIALCIVAFSYALLNVSIRMMNAGFDPFTQVYLRIGLGFVLTSAFFYKQIHPVKFLKISKKDWLFLLLMGTFGYGLAVIFVTIGVLHTKLLNAAIITSTTPFFILLFSVIFLKKRFLISQLFFLLLAFYGVSVIATKSLLPNIANFGIGDLYVLFFAMGLGVYILGRKFLSSHLNNTEIAVIVMFVAFISSLICSLMFGKTLSVTGFLNPIAFAGLLLGGILNLVATLLETYGFKQLHAVAGSQIMLLENVFAPVFGFFFYREIILPVEFLGAIFVISGVWAYIREAKD